jgi:hypothetical protein
MPRCYPLSGQVLCTSGEYHPKPPLVSQERLSSEERITRVSPQPYNKFGTTRRPRQHLTAGPRVDLISNETLPNVL